MIYTPPNARDQPSFPTRRSSDLDVVEALRRVARQRRHLGAALHLEHADGVGLVESRAQMARSEEHTSELQSRRDLVCRLLLEKKKPSECHAAYFYFERIEALIPA